MGGVVVVVVVAHVIIVSAQSKELGFGVFLDLVGLDNKNSEPVGAIKLRHVYAACRYSAGSQV